MYNFSLIKTGTCLALALLLSLITAIYVNKIVSDENSQLQNVENKITIKELSFLSAAIFFAAVMAWIFSRLSISELEEASIVKLWYILIVYNSVLVLGFPYLTIRDNSNLKNFLKSLISRPSNAYIVNE